MFTKCLQKVFTKNLKLKNFGEYHDLFVQSDTLLVADVFENFRNMCLKIYELDLAKFLSAPGLAWQAALEKTKVKVDLFTDTDVNGRQRYNRRNMSLYL